MDTENKEKKPLFNMTASQKFAAAGAAVLAAALVVVAVLWGGTPEYKTLFSSLPDKDGGQVIAALEQMKIPYQLDSGGVLRVPANKVHDVRMKLASQGLPKSGSGFELLDAQKLGTSQFGEQINWQRALEGELAKTIQAVSSVQSARVHLAVPKQSVFKDGAQPTASVFVSLRGGHSLDKSQVAGIVNLVSSSVPNLSPKKVSVVDQNGEPLNQQSEGSDGLSLTGDQINIQRRIEREMSVEIEQLLEPLVGAGNVRAKVRADIDFSRSEETSETYGGNNAEGEKRTVRSQQNAEAADSGAAGNSGIPGAASNTPPVPATAPMAGVKLPPPPAGALAPAAQSTNKQSVINYEVDRVVRNLRAATGGVKRVTVAVVVNNPEARVDGAKADPKTEVTAAAKTEGGTEGQSEAKEEAKPEMKAERRSFSKEDIEKFERLVRQVVGFNEARGDVVNVTNADFAVAPVQKASQTPAWKDPELISMAQEGARYGLIFLAVMYAMFGVIRPLVRRALERPPAPLPPPPAPAPVRAQVDEEEDALRKPKKATIDDFDIKLAEMKEFAVKDPAAVANVIKAWTVGGD